MISRNIQQISSIKYQDKSIENVYLGGITNNLVYYSDVVIKSSAYPLANATYNLEKIPSGKFTCTIWGELGEGKTAFSITGNNGNNGIGTCKKLKDGIYQFIGNWNNVITNKSITIFAAPSSVHTISTITKIKIEEGENLNPIWSPNISEAKKNLLRNTDFKLNLTYWIGGLELINVSVDTNKLLDGRYSIKNNLSGIGNDVNTYRGIRQIIPCYPGDNMTLSYWLLTDDLSTFNTTGRIIGELHFRNSEHTRIKNASTWTKLDKENVWEQFKVIIKDAPPETVEIEVLLCVYRNGRCWFNGIKLESGYNENPVYTSNTYIYDNTNIVYLKKYITGTFASLPETEKESCFYYTSEDLLKNISYNNSTLTFKTELNDGKNPYFYFTSEPYSKIKEIKIILTPINKDISNTFRNCNLLEYIDVSEYNIQNCTDISMIFNNCPKLQYIDGLENWNTSNITTMKSMFLHDAKLIKLNVNNFNTSNCTDLSWMFHSCQSIKELDVSNWDTSNCKTMYALFAYMPSLVSLDLSNFNTDKCIDFRAMFNYNYALTTLDISNFNFINGPYIDSMFYACNKLANLKFGYNCHKYNISFAESPLTRESALSVINGLMNVTEARTCKFKSTTYNLLTPEDIALATSKGWTITS